MRLQSIEYVPRALMSFRLHVMKTKRACPDEKGFGEIVSTQTFEAASLLLVDLPRESWSRHCAQSVRRMLPKNKQRMDKISRKLIALR